MNGEGYIDIATDPEPVTIQVVDGLIDLHVETGNALEAIHMSRTQHDEMFNMQPTYKGIPIKEV